MDARIRENRLPNNGVKDMTIKIISCIVCLAVGVLSMYFSYQFREKHGLDNSGYKYWREKIWAITKRCKQK